MKKLIFVFVLVLVFGGFIQSNKVSACDIINPCANGPVVTQQPGGRFLKPGSEDCPAWFPYFGCYTMRAVGSTFIPLN